jgi:hypothetical protein
MHVRLSLLSGGHPALSPSARAARRTHLSAVGQHHLAGRVLCKQLRCVGAQRARRAHAGSQLALDRVGHAPQRHHVLYVGDEQPEGQLQEGRHLGSRWAGPQGGVTGGLPNSFWGAGPGAEGGEGGVCRPARREGGREGGSNVLRWRSCRPGGRGQGGQRQGPQLQAGGGRPHQARRGPPRRSAIWRAAPRRMPRRVWARPGAPLHLAALRPGAPPRGFCRCAPQRPPGAH